VYEKPIIIVQYF